MKKFYIAIVFAFICGQITNAQRSDTPISYVSPMKDTLILPNNDLGQLICQTWVDTPKHKMPVIIMADEDTIKKKNEILFDTRKKKKVIK